MAPRSWWQRPSQSVQASPAAAATSTARAGMLYAGMLPERVCRFGHSRSALLSAAQERLAARACGRTACLQALRLRVCCPAPRALTTAGLQRATPHYMLQTLNAAGSQGSSEARAPREAGASPAAGLLQRSYLRAAQRAGQFRRRSARIVEQLASNAPKTHPRRSRGWSVVSAPCAAAAHSDRRNS